MNGLERAEVRDAERIRSGAAAGQRPSQREEVGEGCDSINSEVLNPKCIGQPELVRRQERDADVTHGVGSTHRTRNVVEARVRDVRC